MRWSHTSHMKVSWECFYLFYCCIRFIHKCAFFFCYLAFGCRESIGDVPTGNFLYFNSNKSSFIFCFFIIKTFLMQFYNFFNSWLDAIFFNDFFFQIVTFNSLYSKQKKSSRLNSIQAWDESYWIAEWKMHCNFWSVSKKINIMNILNSCFRST